MHQAHIAVNNASEAYQRQSSYFERLDATGKLDILFDRQGILARLHNACPRLATYNDMKEIPGPAKV